MKSITYKIVALFIAFIFSNEVKSQFFAEASTSVFTIESNDLIGRANGVFEFHMQVGKFSSHKKMRSLSLNYRRRTLLDGVETSGNTTSDNKIVSSVFAIGYERKGLFGNTEFDDIWQFYNIVNYHVSFLSFETSYSDPKAPSAFGYGDLPSTVAVDIDLGLGMGRKITRNMYVYLDARLYFPLIDLDGWFISGAGIKSNVGVRYLF